MYSICDAVHCIHEINVLKGNNQMPEHNIKNTFRCGKDEGTICLAACQVLTNSSLVLTDMIGCQVWWIPNKMISIFSSQLSIFLIHMFGLYNIICPLLWIIYVYCWIRFQRQKVLLSINIARVVKWYYMPATKRMIQFGWDMGVNYPAQ